LLIAAGTAAVAAGAAISGLISNNPTGGGSPSASAGYGSADNTSNQMLFNRAGQYTSGYDNTTGNVPVVTMKIQGQDLVGSIKRNQLKGAL
jgi:hypothetical protein